MLIIMYTSCIWFLLLITGTGIDASPCTKVIKNVEPYEVVECTSRIWGKCTHYATLWRYRVSYRRTCCAGYGGYNCQPICSRSCHWRGSCVAPNVCRCRSGYTGSSCQTPVCNPGCQFGSCTSPGVCSCYHGYTGSRCQTRKYFL
ncbi:anterior pharynx in excess protein 1-like, partial [Saccostrea cucullata]|uniref:anterior pharynx in excess protein 1-like n=1 Tax=Saccostrea cuccullata TaxID=36930 RepID=UPI002ED24388